MPNEDLFRKPAISIFLSGAVLDPAVEAHCERLACSDNLLLRMVALGILLDPDLLTETAGQQRMIHTRIGCWVEIIPKHLLREIESLADDELDRQITNLRGADPASFDAVKLLEINAQRDLLEAVSRLLLRANRPYVEGGLTTLDNLMPPEIGAVIAKRSYF